MTRYCPEVRRWGWRTWATYLDDGSLFGAFIRVETSRPETAECRAAQAKRGRRGVTPAPCPTPTGSTIGVPPVQTAAPPAALNPDDVSPRDRSSTMSMPDSSRPAKTGGGVSTGVGQPTEPSGRDAAARVLLRHYYGPDVDIELKWQRRTEDGRDFWRRRADEVLAATLHTEAGEPGE